jgi:exopolyphosphatase/guanosine-5'-triphosphate,3'-diphosphate pyrophosphatase
MGKVKAAIDVGSNAIRMTIFEDKNEDKCRILDSLTQPLQLGKDTFLRGRIGRQQFRAAVNILTTFQRLMRDYSVSEVSAAATSAVREAVNGIDFVDFIDNHTGIKITILESGEETELIFGALSEELVGQDDLLSGNNLLLELGGGNVKTVFIQNGLITFHQVHKIGALRVREILGHLHTGKHKFEQVLRAFIRTDVELLKGELPDAVLDHFIVSGALVPELFRHIDGENHRTSGVVQAETIAALLAPFQDLSIADFARQLRLQPERAEILQAALLIFSDYLHIFAPRSLVLSRVTLSDGLIRSSRGKQIDFTPHILASARYLGRKYKNDENHAGKVLEMAEIIFAKTKSLHKLSNNDLIILQVAAYLHDIGRYVNGREHHKHSEYLIAQANLPGLQRKQIQLAAITARNHRRFPVKYGNNLRLRLSGKEKLRIRKLTAILRLANALDLGHDQGEASVRLKYFRKNRELRFMIRSRQTLQLEEWGFHSAKSLFEELFDVDCTWEVKDK